MTEIDLEKLARHREDEISYFEALSFITAINVALNGFRETMITVIKPNKSKDNSDLDILRRTIHADSQGYMNKLEEIIAEKQKIVKIITKKYKLEKIFPVSVFEFDRSRFIAKVNSLGYSNVSVFAKEHNFSFAKSKRKDTQEYFVPAWLSIVPVLLALKINIRDLKKTFISIEKQSELNDNDKRKQLSRFMLEALGYADNRYSETYRQKKLIDHGIGPTTFKTLYATRKREGYNTFYEKLQKIFYIENKLGRVPIESFFNGPHLPNKRDDN